MGCGACHNNQIYTPENIREFFVKRLLGEFRPHALITPDDLDFVAKMLIATKTADIRLNPAQPVFPLPN
jgi:hypothetical protein